MLKTIILKHLCEELCDDAECKERAEEIANKICHDYTQTFLGKLERDDDGNTIFTSRMKNVSTTLEEE